MRRQEEQEAADVAEVDAAMAAEHNDVNDDQAAPEAMSNVNDESSTVNDQLSIVVSKASRQSSAIVNRRQPSIVISQSNRQH